VKQLYLHIGLPKTGTSAIQNFFILNDLLLEQKYNLLYPRFGRWSDGSHHNIAFALSNNPFCEMKTIKEQVAFLSELDNLISESSATRVLLSSECFQMFDNEVFKNFASHYYLTIICYIRKQDDYLESIYSQNVRDSTMRERRKFSQYFSSFTEQLFFSKLLDKWKLFENQTYIVKEYNKKYFLNNNIIDDFLDIFEIKNEKIFITEKRKINVSLNKKLVEIKRVLNHLDFDELNLVDLLQKFQSKLEKVPVLDIQTSSFFSNSEKTLLVDKVKVDNETLAHNYGIRKLELELNTAEEVAIKAFDRYLFCDFISYLQENNSRLVEKIISGVRDFIANTAEKIEIEIETNILISLILLMNKTEYFFKNYNKSLEASFLNFLISKSKTIISINFENFDVLTNGHRNFEYSIDGNCIILNAKTIDPSFNISKINIIDYDFIVVYLCVSYTFETELECFYQTFADKSYKGKLVSLIADSNIKNYFLLIDNSDFNGQLRIDIGKEEGLYSIEYIKVFGLKDTNSSMLFHKKEIS